MLSVKQNVKIFLYLRLNKNIKLVDLSIFCGSQDRLLQIRKNKMHFAFLVLLHETKKTEVG